MKLHPQLYMPDMVRQIIDGNKTMTSRIITPRNSYWGSLPFGDGTEGWHSFNFKDVVFDGKSTDRQYIKVAAPQDDTRHRIYPKYDPGDIIWVREQFAYTQFFFDKGLVGKGEIGQPGSEIYKADIENHDWDGRWKPNIHMPFDACRLFLKIIRIEADRIQNTTREQAVAEGMCFTGEYKPSWIQTHRFPEENFKNIWKKIHGNGSWRKNDLVWRYVFEKIDKSEVPTDLFPKQKSIAA